MLTLAWVLWWSIAHACVQGNLNGKTCLLCRSVVGKNDKTLCWVLRENCVNLLWLMWLLMSCQFESKFGFERRETSQGKPFMKGKPERENLLISVGRDTLKHQTCVIRMLRGICCLYEETSRIKWATWHVMKHPLVKPIYFPCVVDEPVMWPSW